MAKGESIDFSSFFTPFIGGTLGNGTGAQWFLLVLAELYVLVNFASKYIKNHYVLLAISIPLSWVSYFVGYQSGPMPYYIGVTILCLPLFIGGKIIAPYIATSVPKGVAMLALFVTLASYFTQPYGCNVSMDYIPVHYLSFIMVSISAFIVIAELSRMICKSNWIMRFWSYWGRNTLVILVTHNSFIFMAAIISVYISSLWLALILSLLVVMIMEILVIYIVNHYFKWLLGY